MVLYVRGIIRAKNGEGTFHADVYGRLTAAMLLAGQAALLVACVGAQAPHDITTRQAHQERQNEEQHYQFCAHVFVTNRGVKAPDFPSPRGSAFSGVGCLTSERARHASPLKGFSVNYIMLFHKRQTRRDLWAIAGLLSDLVGSMQNEQREI